MLRSAILAVFKERGGEVVSAEFARALSLHVFQERYIVPLETALKFVPRALKIAGKKLQVPLKLVFGPLELAI